MSQEQILWYLMLFIWVVILFAQIKLFTIDQTLRDILEGLKAKPTIEGLRKCPDCAEYVKQEAIVCRFCKCELSKPIADNLELKPSSVPSREEEKIKQLGWDASTIKEAIIPIVSLLTLFVLLALTFKGCSH